MLKRYYLLILIIFVVSGCARHGAKIQVAPEPISNSGHSTSQYRQVTPFTEVDVQGRVNINLHTGYKRPQVILRGDPRDLAQVKTVVNLSTLYLVLGKGVPRYGAVDADIRTTTLDRVRYVGAGTIRGSQLNTRFLDLELNNPGMTKLGGHVGLSTLDISGGGLVQIDGAYSHALKIHFKGDPKVQLNGVVNLTKLNLDGAGWLSLYWINSDNLIIRAKKSARIQLAGAVNRLDVELWGTANFKGRYLRAQRSFVKTHDKSAAEISSVNHQSSLSTDASDIYYYNLPTTRADFMAYNGSTLDMREWSQPFFRDFTRYNKQFP